MRSEKGKRTLCLCLLFLNLCFIWGNSLLSQEASAAFSRFVGSVLSLFLPGDGMTEGTGQGILRKIAHFTEFTTLGMLLTWLVALYSVSGKKRYLLPLAAGIAVACIDETIQLFVPGRGPGLRDVAIDTAGVVLGILAVSLLRLLKKKHRQQ